MMIKLKIVDETNFEQVIDLSVVEQDKRLLASNVYSLAQTWLFRDRNQAFPYAILSGENVVGFLLLMKNREEREYYIWRLMIDKNQQHRGYGREAIRQVIKMAELDSACDRVRIHYVVGNHRMRSLLDGFHFRSRGLSGNEIVMILDFKNS